MFWVSEYLGVLHYMYHKNPKYSDIQKFAVTIWKFQLGCFIIWAARKPVLRFATR